jgi:CRP-like cAMP-binding protein
MTIRSFEEQVRAAHSPLMDVLLVYAGLQFQVVTQLTACHCLHRIEQRLSRCLLSLLDYAGGKPSVRITHDALAEFLGVHRPSITYALQALVADGTIELERRRVIVRDRALLRAHACECYGVIRNVTARELRRIYELESLRAS